MRGQGDAPELPQCGEWVPIPCGRPARGPGLVVSAKHSLGPGVPPCWWRVREQITDHKDRQKHGQRRRKRDRDRERGRRREGEGVSGRQRQREAPFLCQSKLRAQRLGGHRQRGASMAGKRMRASATTLRLAPPGGL